MEMQTPPHKAAVKTKKNDIHKGPLQPPEDTELLTTVRTPWLRLLDSIQRKLLLKKQNSRFDFHSADLQPCPWGKEPCPWSAGVVVCPLDLAEWATWWQLSSLLNYHGQHGIAETLQVPRDWPNWDDREETTDTETETLGSGGPRTLIKSTGSSTNTPH